jgi:isoquinoline 1-oxidoreductase subunit alpha
VKLTINDQVHEVDVPAEKPLLWVLREDLKMTGTKYGCGKGLCGACTCHLNGAAVRTCVLPASAAVDAKVTTIEGLAKTLPQMPIQECWIKNDVPQCGYCQPGQIMAAAALLAANKAPSEQDIDNAMTNICRCGTYQRIRGAIADCSQKLQKG